MSFDPILIFLMHIW